MTDGMACSRSQALLPVIGAVDGSIDAAKDGLLKSERLANRSVGAGVVEADLRHTSKHRGPEDPAAR